MENPRYAQNVINFYSILEATSRKWFEVVSVNLMGTCLQQIQRVDAKSRKEAFIVEDNDMLENIINTILRSQ